MFTNVPVEESIQLCANLLYESHKVPPVDKETVITLMRMACVNVLVSTPMGFYRQMDGVAMGSPVGPQLANLFLSRFDKELSYRSKVYYRYVDDILRTVKVLDKSS